MGARGVGGLTGFSAAGAAEPLEVPVKMESKDVGTDATPNYQLFITCAKNENYEQVCARLIVELQDERAKKVDTEKRLADVRAKNDAADKEIKTLKKKNRKLEKQLQKKN